MSGIFIEVNSLFIFQQREEAETAATAVTSTAGAVGVLWFSELSSGRYGLWTRDDSIEQALRTVIGRSDIHGTEEAITEAHHAYGPAILKSTPAKWIDNWA